MEGLPLPTHAFIGGSGGKMQAIVEALVAANPGVRILDCMRNFGFQDTELTQIWAAKVETAGAYHMPKAQNPVYIAVMQNPSLDSEEIQWQEL